MEFSPQVLKALIGLAVLFGIIIGLSSLLPSAIAPLGFIRYALGGIWVTLGAPILFSALKLSKKKANNYFIIAMQIQISYNNKRLSI